MLVLNINRIVYWNKDTEASYLRTCWFELSIFYGSNISYGIGHKQTPSEFPYNLQYSIIHGKNQ